MKNNNLETLRHTCEHILTQAVLTLFPKVKMAMGPATEDGFYFDFDPNGEAISEADFAKIEKGMQEIIKKDLSIKKEEISFSEAEKLFANNEYKKEWLADIKKRGEKPTVYWTGENFVDLCHGPHLASTGKVRAFKLISVAGAYWHGDEKNKMLTRIYGTAFNTKNELDSYLKSLNEAKKRDHRKIARDLNLFSFSELVGAGLPLYSPKGALIRRLVNDYVEEVQSKNGYEQVWTPQIAKAELFKISGHYDKYKDSMFKVVSNYSKEEFFLKPMNCPQHTQIYASKPRSYRELPLRLTDFAMLYRDEKPGELSGLARVRSFSQDDCHVFCREDQVDAEVDMALSMTKEIMQTFGFSYKYRLSTRDPKHPEKYIGDPKIWDKVEKWAEKIMVRNNIQHFDGPGEAAFYAPKMDLIATDSLGREWQLSTVQIDFFLPERFNLKYIDSNGKETRPVMIHRAIIGSPERFLMIILENSAGNLPLWLTPTQIKVIPITDRNLEYAQTVSSSLENNGIRSNVDDRSEPLGAKIRNAQLEKTFYMIIVGDKEEKDQKISLRGRDGTDHGLRSLEEFIHNTLEKIAKKDTD